jgi:hypothetical protein
MVNLTGQEFVSAAIDIRRDLKAASPMLSRAQRKQLAQASAALAPIAKTNPKHHVTDAEKNSLYKRFQSAPFTTLDRTVYTACQNFKQYQKAH